MATVSLVLLALYVVLAFGGRTFVQLRSTGSTGFKGISGRPFSAEWAGGVLFVVAIALVLAAPVLDLAGAVGSVGALDGPVWRAAGFALFGLGLAGTLISQGAMGASWRIGVDEAERTELVTAGPFALVRNPIFSAMVSALAGTALLVPNAAALVGVAALVAAVEIQVRLVEEPYLTRAHGSRYADYASRVGRFFPGVGRLKAGDGPARTRGLR